MILKNWGVQTNRYRSIVTTFVAKNKASVPCSKLIILHYRKRKGK
jgi:hypothetical protein